MVFAINSDESGPRNFAAFQALAKQLNATASNSTGGSSGGGSSGGSSGAGVVNGIASGSVVALVAGFIALLL